MDNAIDRPYRRSLARRARTWFEIDAMEWGLPARAAVVLAALPVVATVLVAVAHASRPFYRFLTEEDSVLEWGQVAFLAAASLLLALTAAILARRREWLWVAVFGAGAAAAFFIGGEEISWGQRLLGIATPEEVARINNQGELSLHNLNGVLRTLNFFTMLGAGTLMAMPFGLAILRARGWLAPGWAYRLVPPLALTTAFAIPFAYRLARFILSKGSSGSFAEVIELSLYFGVAVFAFLIRRRLRTDPGVQGADQPSRA